MNKKNLAWIERLVGDALAAQKVADETDRAAREAASQAWKLWDSDDDGAIEVLQSSTRADLSARKAYERAQEARAAVNRALITILEKDRDSE